MEFALPLAQAQANPAAVPPAAEAPQTLPPDATDALGKYQGQTVTDIEFHGITATDPGVLRSVLVQKTNEPLEREKLRQSLQALYATGRFAALQVEAEPGAHGLTLIFDVTENYFNGAITVDGTPQKTNPKPNQLIAATQLDLGGVFSEENVVHSVERMKKVLADSGYYKATVTYELKPNPADSQMAIHFHVVPGELARVGKVSIVGDTGIPPDRVRSLTKLKTGDKVKNDHVNRALERLRKHYQKNAHLEAQVSLTNRKYDPATNALDYIFQVDQGPTVSGTPFPMSLLPCF